MKGGNNLTQILDFRRVINNQKSVGTRRAAAAAQHDEYSGSWTLTMSTSGTGGGGNFEC